MTLFHRSLLLLLSALVATAAARKGPNHGSIRALGMGNAFVAVAEDRNAIYYNPAGLNLLNKVGNYEKRPDLGYYPDNWLDMRLAVGTSFILPDLFGITQSAVGFWTDHENTINKMGDDAAAALAADTTFYADALFIDGLNFPLGWRPVQGEIAFHNYGMALWTEAVATMAIDPGIITPMIRLSVAAIGVGQIGLAREITPRLSAGIGYRLVKTEQIPEQVFGIMSASNDSISTQADTLMARVQDNLLTFDHAVDLGAMYQFTRETRFGGALQNIFIGGYQEKSVTPELTIGVVHSPRKFQRNTAYARKVNFAADFEDALNNDRNYKFFSHLNLGMEMEQVLLAIPSLKLGSNARALMGRGSFGLKGGYWTLGAGMEVLRVFNFDFVTWAEEGGYYTGQSPQRYFLMEIGLGL